MKFFPAALLVLISQLQLLACGGYFSGDFFTSHEWGTFTSLQGGDGVQFEWRPGVGADLPPFIHTCLQKDSSLAGESSIYALGKGRQSALQRMETPVIYFYSSENRTVNVRVDFPKGIVTESHPRVSAFGPTLKDARKSFIEWKGVNVLAHSAADDSLPLLPPKQGSSHYFAARETDANVLTVGSDSPDLGKQEQEKFLFYRGLGNFTAPLKAELNPDETTVRVTNTGGEELRHLRVINIRDGEGSFLQVAKLAPGASADIPLDASQAMQPLAAMDQALGASLQTALTQEGLFPKEAAAIVQTWRESWFQESGLRVLYVLPHEWTDRVLPLDIKPAPTKTVRVMVGRAELIRPRNDQKLRDELARFMNTDANAHATIASSVNRLGFGRFLEPVLFRSIQDDTNPATLRAAQALLLEVSRLPKPTFNTASHFNP